MQGMREQKKEHESKCDNVNITLEYNEIMDKYVIYYSVIKDGLFVCLTSERYDTYIEAFEKYDNAIKKLYDVI